MRKIYVPNSQVREFDKLVKETFDCREGVVMDSFVGELKNGRMFVALDTFETSWTSGLTVYLGTEKQLWKVWDEFTEKYDEEFDEAE